MEVLAAFWVLVMTAATANALLQVARLVALFHPRWITLVGHRDHPPLYLRLPPALRKAAAELRQQGFLEIGTSVERMGLLPLGRRIFFRSACRTYAALGQDTNAELTTLLTDGTLVQTGIVAREWRGSTALQEQLCVGPLSQRLQQHQVLVRSIVGEDDLAETGSMEDYLHSRRREFELRLETAPANESRPLERTPRSVHAVETLHDMHCEIRSKSNFLPELRRTVAVRMTDETLSIAMPFPWSGSCVIPLASLLSVGLWNGALELVEQSDSGPRRHQFPGYGSPAELAWLVDLIELKRQRRLQVSDGEISAPEPPAELLGLMDRGQA